MKTLIRLAVLCIVVTSPGPIVHAQATGVPRFVYSAAMEVTHGKPYVQVMIDGKGPFRFLIDTGTGGDAIVTSALAAQLNLPAAGVARLNDPSGMGGQTAHLRRIDTLRVAGMDFYAIKAIEHTLPNGDGTCQGILGFTLFRELLLTLDYVNGKLVLSGGGLEPDGEKSVLSFRMPEGVPIARLTIGNKQVEAQMDSGGAGLSLPAQFIAGLRFTADPALFGKGHSLLTRFEIKVAKLDADIRLGDITIDHPWVEINPAFPLANFGSVPMQHFIITFDQQHKLVRLDGPRKRITLGVTPTPLRLVNVPGNPSESALVPVG